MNGVVLLGGGLLLAAVIKLIIDPVSYTHLGAVAGFFCYPLDTLREEEGSQKIFDFRDKLEEVLTGGDGSEAVSYTHLDVYKRQLQRGLCV